MVVAPAPPLAFRKVSTRALLALRCTAQCGRETSKGFDQGFAAGGMIQELTRAGSHGGNNVGGLVDLADGKNRDFGNAGVDQFDGANSSLRILGIDIHQDDFDALILQLTQDGIARSQGEPDVAQCRTGKVRALHPAVQYDGLFAVLGKEGDSDPGHDSILSVHSHATNFQRPGPSDLRNRKGLQTKRRSPANP